MSGSDLVRERHLPTAVTLTTSTSRRHRDPPPDFRWLEHYVGCEYLGPGFTLKSHAERFDACIDRRHEQDLSIDRERAGAGNSLGG